VREDSFILNLSTRNTRKSREKPGEACTGGKRKKNMVKLSCVRSIVQRKYPDKRKKKEGKKT